MQIKSKKDAKTAVSALRREIQNLNKAPDALSHSDCLTLMAKALGFKSWNAWEATLVDDVPSTAAQETPVTPRYPLKNDKGQFDFTKPGEEAVPYTSFFQALLGTSESIRGTADIDHAVRKNGAIVVEYAGSTDVDWDSQKTLKKNEEKLWVDESGDDVPESELILLPSGFEECGFDYLYEHEELPVREPLVLEFVEYLTTASAQEKFSGAKTRKAVLKVIDEAENLLGFALTALEVAEVVRRVAASKLDLL